MLPALSQCGKRIERDRIRLFGGPLPLWELEGPVPTAEGLSELSVHSVALADAEVPDSESSGC